MTHTETARCYLLVCAAYERPATDAAIEAWHVLLGGLDAAVALEATRRLCLRDSGHAPRPGEIAAEAARLTGDEPPSLDAAIGFFLAGQWDTHPAVLKAARECRWDRHNAPEQARWEFRARYHAVLHDLADDARLPIRDALTKGPTRLDTSLVLPNAGEAGELNP